MRDKCPVSDLMKLTLMKLQIDRSALDAGLTCCACGKAGLNTSRGMQGKCVHY